MDNNIIKTLEKDCREYRELLRMREEITAEMESLADQIKAIMGNQETVTAGEYKITNKTVVSSRLDTTAIKAALPDIAKRFTKTSTYKRFAIN